jgi:hypothetical protein
MHGHLGVTREIDNQSKNIHTTTKIHTSKLTKTIVANAKFNKK